MVLSGGGNKKNRKIVLTHRTFAPKPDQIEPEKCLSRGEQASVTSASINKTQVSEEDVF